MTIVPSLLIVYSGTLMKPSSMYWRIKAATITRSRQGHIKSSFMDAVQTMASHSMQVSLQNANTNARRKTHNCKTQDPQLQDPQRKTHNRKIPIARRKYNHSKTQVPWVHPCNTQVFSLDPICNKSSTASIKPRIQKSI